MSTTKIKGPASAPTLPSHGSSKSHERTKPMNTQMSTTIDRSDATLIASNGSTDPMVKLAERIVAKARERASLEAEFKTHEGSRPDRHADGWSDAEADAECERIHSAILKAEGVLQGHLAAFGDYFRSSTRISKIKSPVVELAREIGNDLRCAEYHNKRLRAAVERGVDENVEYDRCRSAALFHEDRAEARMNLFPFTRARSELDAAVLLARAVKVLTFAMDRLGNIETIDATIDDSVVSILSDLGSVQSMLGSAGYGLNLEREVEALVGAKFAKYLTGMWSDRPGLEAAAYDPNGFDAYPSTNDLTAGQGIASHNRHGKSQGCWNDARIHGGTAGANGRKA